MAHYEQGTKCTSKRASNGQAGKGEAQKTGATKRCILPDTSTFLQLSGKKLCYVKEKVASQPGLYDDRLQDALFLLLPLQGYLQPWGIKNKYYYILWHRNLKVNFLPPRSQLRLKSFQYCL
ncbi:hypothetical protein KIL84_015634 [Mauremys mutica]|uniref:Uncharacterized protein n=1 Tax=Mauremys mutica TaxID=74926 RepID=A0A9D3WQV0_9SAUR|nr:hypothetical protein KIL84_015634 [Mauremys mutica]